MRKNLGLWILLVFLAAQLPLQAQNTVIVLDYMKVKPGKTEAYLSVEKEWKKIHQKKVDEGICSGWQLWRVHLAGSEDPYQFITINWYDNFAQSFEDYPEDFLNGIFTEKEAGSLFQKTMESREMVGRQMAHLVTGAENCKSSSIIVLNNIHVKPGQGSNYVSLERDIYKPYHEESIKRGYRTNWVVWSIWPFGEDTPDFVAVDGYASPEQMMTGEDLLSEVHPDLTWEEISKQTSAAREISGVEIWELVDSVFPE